MPGGSRPIGSGLFSLLHAASFISPEKSRKMLPTPVGTSSGTSLLGPSLLDGNSRDSFVSRSLADVAEVSAWPHPESEHWPPPQICQAPAAHLQEETSTECQMGPLGGRALLQALSGLVRVPILAWPTVWSSQNWLCPKDPVLTPEALLYTQVFPSTLCLTHLFHHLFCFLNSWLLPQGLCTCCLLQACFPQVFTQLAPALARTPCLRMPVSRTPVQTPSSTCTSSRQPWSRTKLLPPSTPLATDHPPRSLVWVGDLPL